MKIKPYNNIVIAKPVEEKASSVIVRPDQNAGRFVKLEILDIGELVDFKPTLKIGDKIIANNLFEILDPLTKVGFVNSKDILAKYE